MCFLKGSGSPLSFYVPLGEIHILSISQLAVMIAAVLEHCQLIRTMSPKYLIRLTGPVKSSSHLAMFTQPLGSTSMRLITSRMLWWLEMIQRWSTSSF